MNRKQTWKNRVHSGFTLLEMMISLGIIAILTAILIPTVNSYLTRSRLNTANSNAKVIFNSLQTIMQEYEFSDRTQPESSDLYGFTTDPITSKNTPIRTGKLYFSCNNGVLAITSSGSALDPSVVGGSLATASPTSIGSRMSRLYTDYQTVCWKAYVEDYSVRGVVCATVSTTDYVGGYPVKASERGVVGNITASGGVGGIDETTLAGYCTAAWT